MITFAATRTFLARTAFCSALLSALPTVAQADIVAVDFKEQGTFQTDVWRAGALTVTGSDTLNFLQYNGIGVVGQIDDAIDPGESVIFSFARPATYVKLYNGSIGNLGGIKFNTATVQAYGADGILLGEIAGVEPTPWLILSSYFGDTPIKSFSVSATEDSYRFSALDFALVVPEPRVVSMLIGGLFVLSLAARRSRS